MCQGVLFPAPRLSVLMLVDAFLPLARTCPDYTVHWLGCSYYVMCQGVLFPAPSLSFLTLVDASLLLARTCLDHTALPPRCSCSSMWKDALDPTIPSEYLRRLLPFSMPHCNVPAFH